MVHKPWTIGAGTADDMRSIASRMDQTEEEALDLYEAATALPRQELRAAMAAETYYTPKEATAVGFATEAIEPFAIAACMSPEFREKYHSKLPSDVAVVLPTEVRKAQYASQLRYHPKNW
jgi:hypothetical protein